MSQSHNLACNFEGKQQDCYHYLIKISSDIIIMNMLIMLLFLSMALFLLDSFLKA